jgi:hypothetical protein
VKKERMFFSEEKNQKTFNVEPYPLIRPWPGTWGRLKNKSLLLLFLRKEVLNYLLISQNRAPT